jgi:uncharacterized membrane protein YphA (DoxX/SURF4 family)
MNIHTALYACGAILLGVIGIVFSDFALQWQPVPAGFPLRQPFAYVSAVLLLAGGAMMLSRRADRAGAWLLAVFYGVWVVALHLPVALKSWKHIGVWNGPAELTFLTMGGLAFVASSLGPARRPITLTARILAGASACVFGLAHFNYIDFTATFVPAWLPPSQVFWAWATGAGHLAAGLALISGVQARLAATCLAGMMGSFVLLVHVPRLLATPDVHAEWVMLGVASSLSGAAWLIRKYAL